MKAWLLALAVAAAPQLQAATFRGTVTHVTDGDTLWVRPANGGAPVEIRLLHMDAPEGCQRFGAEAKRALRDRVLDQRVRVRTDGTDVYQRHLARVEHRGEDVGGWMVRQGYAWSITFQGQPGPYAHEQDKARIAGRGLWTLPGAVDPRSFRKRFGRCQ